jgi:hypothetical protein
MAFKLESAWAVPGGLWAFWAGRPRERRHLPIGASPSDHWYLPGVSYRCSGSQSTALDQLSNSSFVPFHIDFGSRASQYLKLFQALHLERSSYVARQRVFPDAKQAADSGLQGELDRITRKIDTAVVQARLVKCLSLAQSQSRKFLEIFSSHGNRFGSLRPTGTG